MRFLFDCEDEICLPAAYRLVDEVKPFIDKMKAVEVGDDETKGGRKIIFKKIIENMMVKYRRPPRGGRGLKLVWRHANLNPQGSSSSRRTWIEIN